MQHELFKHGLETSGNKLNVGYIGQNQIRAAKPQMRLNIANSLLAVTLIPLDPIL